MGTMSREIRKLRGRTAYEKVQNSLDQLSDAQISRAVQDSNNQYLRQLYYGIETLIERIEHQESMIEDLVNKLNKGRNVSIRKEDVEYSKAQRLIRENIDKGGRITWRKVSDPMELIFAYIMKMERQGIDVNKTTALQDIPEYRRVFQYVAYNIGHWKDVIDQYENRKKNSGEKRMAYAR